jgi:RNA-binding protein NOB1
MDAAGFNIETLVLDAAPLLSTANSSNPASLRGLAQNFVTTPDVLGEIRDKTSRELFASTLQLLGIDGAASGVASGEALSSENGGLQVKQPSEEAVARGALLRPAAWAFN